MPAVAKKRDAREGVPGGRKYRIRRPLSRRIEP
jgi:hypothetical protein